MLHNSLLIRDFLKARNADSVCVGRRAVHRLVVPLPLGHANGVVLDGAWDVVVDPSLAGERELKADAIDYLGRCGVALAPGSPRVVSVSRDALVQPGAYHLVTSDGSITIAASNAAGAWAGWIRVEKEISTRRERCIATVDETVRPAWPVQIGQAPFGSNFLVPDLSEGYLSDDAFLLLAHLGCNGMTIYGDWLLYVKSKIFPELDHVDYESNVSRLKDATERAGKYGVSLYFVPVSPKLPMDHPVFRAHPSARGARLERGFRKGPGDLHCLCSSSDECLAFVAETWESLFESVPLLGGIILIVGGESYYHCFMAPDKTRRAGDAAGLTRTNCIRCGRMEPEAVVARLTGITADAVHKSSPWAIVAAWPYSGARWSADPYQVDLIDALPTGVSFQSEIDKDQWIHKSDPGYSKHVWDYSVDYTGPSDRIREQAAACHSRGIPLFVKTETAIGLEFIHVPYVPCLDRLAEKWANVHALCPSGVLQSWMFFGTFGSRAEELGWWSCWRPGLGTSTILDSIAARDFGAASNHVRRAWVMMSEAMGHVPCIPPYFIGPFFLGPAHPLLPHAGMDVPDAFKGALYYKQEHEASLSVARIGDLESLVMNSLPDFPNAWGFVPDSPSSAWPVFLSEFYQAMRSSKAAHDAMVTAVASTVGVGTDQRQHVHEEALLVEFMHRTLVTCYNTFAFLLARDRPGTVGGRNAPLDPVAIARDELENAMHARPLYEGAPWLGLELRLEGRFPRSLDMLAAKEKTLFDIIGTGDVV